MDGNAEPPLRVALSRLPASYLQPVIVACSSCEGLKTRLLASKRICKEDIMTGLKARNAWWGFAVIFGISLLLPWDANIAPGAEIKLPPLRVRVGEKAPDFTLPNAGGKAVRLSDFSGRNVLIDLYRGYW
jgi:AhpC/TSA family